MRHKKHVKKFHRTEEERKKLWTQLCTALIKEEQIITTTEKAKWFRAYFDRLVTLCKRAGDDVKLAYYKVRPFLSEPVARKLIEELLPNLQTRNSGYTAQYKLVKPFGSSGYRQSVVKLIRDSKSSETKTTKAKDVKSETVKALDTSEVTAEVNS
jgi:large subunit ribosomal protein L17